MLRSCDAATIPAMHKPGADPDNVQMSDVLCDFCRREWTEDVPFVEGHRGAVICGHCLALAYSELAGGSKDSLVIGFSCRMCLESEQDRAALGRADEPGWPSPTDREAVICRRCAKQAAGVLHKDAEFDWEKPG